MRPDRPEVMTPAGSGKFLDIEPGVRLECLAGTDNGARGLTVGLVTLQPETALTYHTHTFAESITLLRGAAIVAVEGREYSLAPLDNVLIPRGPAHQIRNPSTVDPTLLHVALASDSPARTMVADTFKKQEMPADSLGIPGAERVTRFLRAKRDSTEPNTEFIDYFNETLVPGLNISGGHARFAPGGRLPAHVHDFDESISIIEGEASCIVEGRRYTLGDNGTAMVPRGRVHYFMNESAEAMAMLWVYAGPSPIRVAVDESCATTSGDPWREADRG
jgi:quercetin dioxygenase-like cupin family protein